MITLLENAVPTNLTQQIRERCGVYLNTKPHNSFNRICNRVGKTVNVSTTPELAELDREISSFMQHFTIKFVEHVLRPSYGVADTGYEFHRYAAGEHCLVHSDNDIIFTANSNSTFLRFATVIMHLNTVNNGGETRFPNQNQSYKTVEGQILVFPPTGAYPHYVTPADDERDILMTWLVYDRIRVMEV